MTQDCGKIKKINQWELSIAPWIVCISASLFFFYEFIQGNMFASIADNVMRDFHIQADKMAYLSSVYYVSNVLFLFVAGYVLDHYSTKKTLLTAMLLCVMSTFILANASSFYVALGCRFITGIGSAFCFLGPVRVASRWFPPQRMAMVTGIIVTIAMTGGMLAQYPLTKLTAQIGWRDALMHTGWLGFLIWVLMIFSIWEKPSLMESVKKNNLLTTAKKVYLNFQTIKAALYATLMNMAVAVFGAMMGTLYLIQRLDVTKEEAAIVNSMLFLGAIVGGPVLGWISDKLRLRIMPMVAGALLSLLTVLLILWLPVSLWGMKVLFLMLGFFTAAQIISYALVAESNCASLTARAVSVVSILVQGGYIVYQNAFSVLLIKHGDMHMVNGTPVYSLNDYHYASMILPLGLVLSLLVLVGLKETHGKRMDER